MKKNLVYSIAVLATAGVSACNGGHASGGTLDNTAASTANTSNSHQIKVRLTADKEATPNKKYWEEPFIIQSIKPTQYSNGVDSYIVIPHLHYIYSQYNNEVDISNQSNTFSPQLRKDIFSPTLSSGEQLVSMKPCYFEIAESTVNMAQVSRNGWANVAITNLNRVFINLSNETNDNIEDWDLIKTPFANDKDIKLNSLACFVEKDKENEGDEELHLLVVGNIKHNDKVYPYSALGYTQSSQISDKPVLSWRVIDSVNNDLVDMSLNDVAVGDVSEDPEDKDPGFLAVGQKGIFMWVKASYTSPAPKYKFIEAEQDGDSTDLNAIAFDQMKQKFVYGGKTYFGSITIKGNTTYSSSMIRIGTRLPASSHFIPDLDDRARYGLQGITSIGCYKGLCALAVKSGVDEDSDEFRTSTIFVNMASNGLTVERVKDFPEYSIGSSALPSELNPQIYVDELLGRFYLLTSERNGSKVYSYNFGDTGDMFRPFITTLPTSLAK